MVLSLPRIQRPAGEREFWTWTWIVAQWCVTLAKSSDESELARAFEEGGREKVASCRVSELADGFKGMSTLHNMSKWVQKERFGLPEYLLRTCPSSLRERAEVEDEVPLGLPRSPELVVPNAACP